MARVICRRSQGTQSAVKVLPRPGSMPGSIGGRSLSRVTAQRILIPLDGASSRTAPPSLTMPFRGDPRSAGRHRVARAGPNRRESPGPAPAGFPALGSAGTPVEKLNLHHLTERFHHRFDDIVMALSGWPFGVGSAWPPNSPGRSSITESADSCSCSSLSAHDFATAEPSSGKEGRSRAVRLRCVVSLPCVVRWPGASLPST